MPARFALGSFTPGYPGGGGCFRSAGRGPPAESNGRAGCRPPDRACRDAAFLT
jgi:hypothetical protein